MESLLETLSLDKRHIDADVVESLERGFDCLHELVQRVVQRKALAPPRQAIAHFESLVDAPDADAATAVNEPADTYAGAEAEPAHAAADAGAQAPAAPPAARPQLLPEQESARAATQEMIRVRADRIDSLVNAAGEVSIYRARLEQQISGFRFNLTEFEQTV